MRLRRLFAVLTVVAFAVLGAAAPAEAGKHGSSPKTPTNLRITASSAHSVSLAWDASSSSSNNWWYCVQSSGSGCIRVDPPKTTITLPLQMPGRTYTFSVYAVDINGNRSGNSNSVSVTTPPDTTAPSPTPVLSLVKAYPTRISVSWTAAKDDYSQVWYSLFVDGAPFSENHIGFGSATLLDVVPGSTHTFQVTARDASFNTVQSNTLTVTAPPVTETVPPSAPTNLTLAPPASSPEIWLEWTPSTDNHDAQSEIMYDVFLNGVFEEHMSIGAGDGIVYCVNSGPTTVVLRAVDTSGNVSEPSNSIVFDC